MSSNAVSMSLQTHRWSTTHYLAKARYCVVDLGFFFRQESIAVPVSLIRPCTVFHELQMTFVDFSERDRYMSSCVRLSVVCRLSVVSLSSVCNVRAPYSGDWNFPQYFYIIRKIIYPSFLRRGMVGGRRPLLPEIWGQPTPVGAKSPIFNRYLPVAPQP